MPQTVQFPYAGKTDSLQQSVVTVGSASFGAEFVFIAGPCSVESEAQICAVATSIKRSGAVLLRAGAYKPRTSPYSFQGLQADGLELLRIAKQQTGLPIVSEIMDASLLPQFRDVDMIQVGARNMQNFALLQALGREDKPILLKRGPAATIEELLFSAEYIMAGGNRRVVLCERGIRSFEPLTRNTLDLSAVPLLKQMTHLPVIVDPSHGTGRADLVPAMALAATAAGADGLMIEVHNDPEHAKSDGPQSVTPEQFAEIAKRVQKLLAVR